MVESAPNRDIVSRIVIKFTQMSIFELVPLLDLPDLVRFHQLNKACNGITKVGSPKCLRYDVLFSRWSSGRVPSGHAWREELVALQAQEGTTAGDMLQKMLGFLKLIETSGTKYGNTYSRYNWESQRRELLGYAGGNSCAHSNNKQYFTHTMVPNSIFGKPLLHLKTVCWFRPWVVVENIPSSWTKIDIDIHHVYLKYCDLNGINYHVLMVPQSTINDEELQWAELAVEPFTRSRDQPENQYVTEHLTTVSLPENANVGTHYAIKFQLKECGGGWKSNWQWDGITIRQAC